MAIGTPEIPERIKEKLQQEGSWFGKTIAFLENLTPYFNANPYFFPEYTIHGTLHVQHVLELIDRLIPDASLEQLSTRETALLVMAAAAHDIGMFLERDGVQELLFGAAREQKTALLDDETWEMLWQGHLRRIKNLPDTELIKRFGEATQVTPPPRDMDKLDHRDILIYGDFLRQYHPRLAHDILVKGLYGARTTDLFRNVGLDRELKDLIGLIARSHGMALRDTQQYLVTNYGQARKPKNTAVFYLMALLRLADYLDAGESRAPVALEARQGLRAQLSREEFEWNQSIDHADYVWEPEHEVLRVHASPETGIQYARIESWLNNVQEELDRCWAVLGEHYGRDAGMELSIRRVDSNLFCPETRKEYEKHFLTHPPKLGVNPDILKLLIAPLYGDDPSFGVRELLQNAVDACRERKLLEQQAGKAYKGNISVHMDKGQKRFTITDNGTGMTAEVISNYFLVAGSSYRRSEEWAEHFIDDGKARVARTGRFGIGVLAAFLIGSEVTIRSRHMGEDLGYVFTMHLDQETIDVVRCGMEAGTEICIELSDKVIEKFNERDYRQKVNWNEWYYLDDPKVTYSEDGKKIKGVSAFDSQQKKAGWEELGSDLYPSYQWRYEQYSYKQLTLCNGIRIPEYDDYYIGEESGWQFELPDMMIMDPENHVEVNLARTTLLELPDGEKLTREVYRKTVANMLTIPVEMKDLLGRFEERGWSYGTNMINEKKYVAGPRGFTLAGTPFLNKTGEERLYVACVKEADLMQLIRQLDAPACLLGQNKERMTYDFYKCVYDGSLFHRRTFETIYKLEAMWMEKELFDTDLIKRFPQWVLKTYQKQGENETHYCLSPQKTDAKLLELPLDWARVPFLCRCGLELPDTSEDPKNLMRQTLDEYLGGDVWIPYDQEERKKKFAGAFKKLNKYIKED